MYANKTLCVGTEAALSACSENASRPFRDSRATMQNDKERVALTSIAASGGLTLAKAVVGAADRLACHPLRGRAFADRSSAPP